MPSGGSDGHVDLDRMAPSDLPVEVAVSALTMAELAAGPPAAANADERARRSLEVVVV